MFPTENVHVGCMALNSDYCSPGRHSDEWRLQSLLNATWYNKSISPWRMLIIAEL